MYNKIMMKDNRLIAISDSEKQVFIGKKNNYLLSINEITEKNKIEECEERILDEKRNQMKYKTSMKKNRKYASLCYGFSMIMTILFFLLVLVFAPLSSFVSNMGLLVWITAFVGGGCLGHRFQNKVEEEFEKLNDSKQYCDVLKNKIQEEKTFFNVLQMIHQKELNEQPQIEQSYNEQLKNSLMDFREELQKIEQFLKEEKNEKSYTKIIRK